MEAPNSPYTSDPQRAIIPPIIHKLKIVMKLFVPCSWNPNEVKTPTPMILAITKAEVFDRLILFDFKNSIF